MTLRNLKGTITLAALAIVLARVLWPELRVDAVSLGLLALAVLPWLSPLIKSAELPGGWKIEFQEVKEAGEKIASPTAAPSGPVVVTPGTGHLEIQGYAPTIDVGGTDPNLVLVSLRIEIERRLRLLAQAAGLRETDPLRQIAIALRQRKILTDPEFTGLSTLIDLGNKAAHGASVEPDVIAWAKGSAAPILSALDDKRRRL